MNPGGKMFSLHLAVGLVSAALIALQLVLMQLLSISQWHHFAYLVISIALLGFGAAGTTIALCREWLLERIAWMLPLLMLACAAATAGVPALIGVLFRGFDSYLLLLDPSHMARLLATSLLFALPFYLGALAIELVFVRYVERIGTFYFANLLGSGLGGVAGLALLAAFHIRSLPAITACIPLMAAALLLCRQRRNLQWGAGLLALLFIAAILFRPPALELSPYKDLQSTLLLPEARVVAERSSPYGLVQVVQAPGLRAAPGMSLNYPGEVPQGLALFNNGNWFGALPQGASGSAPSPLDYTTAALPYSLIGPQKVLVLQAATGMEVAQALDHGAQKVVAVEPHRSAVDVVSEEFSRQTSGLWQRPEVRRVHQEPRSWLAGDPAGYDLITMPPLGIFGGAAGLFALQEQHLLTRQGIGDMLGHLNPEGLVCLSCWMDYPPRAPLRLAATLVEALGELGIDQPAKHLLAVRSWGTITFCAKPTPFSQEQLAAVRDFCRRMQFDPALLPGLSDEHRQVFHQLQDDRFFTLLDQLLGPERAALFRDYSFRLQPSEDDRPFFSQFLRWESLPRLAALFGNPSAPFLELGYVIVVISFVQMSLAAAVLILLPLFRLGWRSGSRLRTLFYFGGLALGYMLVEISLIHRFVLYLGHPVYAAAAVICTLLVSSGAGSCLSARLPPTLGRPEQAAGLVTVLLLLYSLALPPILELSLALPLAQKALVTLGLIAPVGFAMGFPFPLGLQQTARQNEADVPWALGINGSLSVLATSLATLLAVEVGFSAVLLVAAGCYGAATMAHIGMR